MLNYDFYKKRRGGQFKTVTKTQKHLALINPMSYS